MGSGKIDNRRGVTRCGHDGAQIRWPACGEFSDKGRREGIHGLEGPLNRDDGVRHVPSKRTTGRIRFKTRVPRRRPFVPGRRLISYVGVIS